MDLIDKGTHLENANGDRFAKSESHEKKRNCSTHGKRIKPADSDILFGLWIEHVAGRLTVLEICALTGKAKSTIIRHAKFKDFDSKAAIVLKKAKKTDTNLAERVATNLADRILAGKDAHQESVEEMLGKTRKHFGKLKAPTILNRIKDIKTVVDMGREHYSLDTEEKQAGPAPVLNIAVLLGDGVKVVTSVPAT